MKKQFLTKLSAMIFLTATLSGCGNSKDTGTINPSVLPIVPLPNIIVIITDDMRWDALGAAGNNIISTPNLDKLAHEGIRFTNSFVTSSICSTSRASLYTGQYARRHGIWNFETSLSPKQLVASYPMQLRDAGYHTAFVGKWGIGSKTPNDSFDFWAGFEGQGSYFEASTRGDTHLTRHLGNAALEFLDLTLPTKPFAMTIATKAPHAQDFGPNSFIPAPEFSDLYENDIIPKATSATEKAFQAMPDYIKKSLNRQTWQWRFSSEDDYQRSVKQYYRLITGIDTIVGRVVEKLKVLDVYDNTVIIFTSDNGFLLGEHGLGGKWLGLEESIRTPLIIKPVTNTAYPLIANQMVLNIDLAPTILELARLPIPASYQGKSLIPLFNGSSATFRNEWFYEQKLEFPWISESEGIRSKQYKYLWHYKEPNNAEFLFDLQSDPLELHNLAETALHSSTIDLYRQKIYGYRKSLE